MCTPSVIQLLPSHIIKLIVNHVVGSGRVRFEGVERDSTKYKKLLGPLLQVCHNFRVVAHSLYCNDYWLHLYVQPQTVTIKECSWTRRVRDLDPSVYLLSREIQLQIHVCDIYDGRALQQLTAKPYDGCAFQHARKLTFDLVTESSRGSGCTYALEGADANIMTFVQRIKDMAPRVSKVCLGITDMDGYLVSSSDSQLRLLFSTLSTLTMTLLTNGCAQLLHCPDLVPVCKLAHIDYAIGEDASKVLQLARLNAQTLQIIHIWSEYDVDISGLILDPGDGSYVEYPCLRSLTMLLTSVVNKWQGCTKGAVPFPRLRRLVLDSGYPFGDDVMFRGNGATLEYLKIALYPGMVKMLKGFGVFTRTSHPRLECVNTTLPSSLLDSFATAAEHMQFVLDIAPGASVRAIDCPIDDGGTPLPVLSTFEDYANIQVLSLSLVQLLFWDALALIKALPLLSDLYALDPVLDKPPQGVTKADLPEYVRSAYAPMGKRFRCWHVTTHFGYNREELVLCTLLLALVCPNFDYTAVARHLREQFMKEMRSLIAEPEFSDHAPRLNRLLFDGVVYASTTDNNLATLANEDEHSASTSKARFSNTYIKALGASIMMLWRKATERLHRQQVHDKQV